MDTYFYFVHTQKLNYPYSAYKGFVLTSGLHIYSWVKTKTDGMTALSKLHVCA